MGILGESRAAGVPFETVLAAAQSGAPWACTTLWREYSATVAGFARGRGSRDPDDLTSEVFLTVFEQLGTFSGTEAEFRSFIFSIAYRRVVDELRQRGRRGEAIAWVPELDVRSEQSAEDAAGERASRDSVMSILDGLPVDQRNVMVLRVVYFPRERKMRSITSSRSSCRQGWLARRRPMRGKFPEIARRRAPHPRLPMERPA